MVQRRIGIVMVSLSLTLVAVTVIAHPHYTLDIKTVELAAHIGFDNVDLGPGLPKYVAPRIPDQGAVYDISDIISCDDDFVPVAAWYDTITSWPSHDAMYGMQAFVDRGRVHIGVRSRQASHWTHSAADHRGYSYIKVYVLCRR